MKKYLKKVKERPDHEKTKIVKIMAAVATGVIFIIYLLILALVPGKEQVTQENTQQDALGAFSDILNSGFDQIGNIGSELQEQRNAIDLSPEALETLANENQEESVDLINQPEEMDEFINIENPINETNLEEVEINVTQSTE